MPPLPAGPYFSADIDGANLCGSKTSSGIECSTGEESPAYRTLIPTGEYVKVETFAGLICALTRVGELSCWNSTCLNQPFCPAPFELLDLRTGLSVSIHFEGEEGSLDEDVSCE